MVRPKEERAQAGARVGVYICHCGTNIAGVVDVEAVCRYAAQLDQVVVARHYDYMCSDPGQALIAEDIKKAGLERVVVASCSPLMHETTFRNACASAGLNPYLFQMTNIREQCAWVTGDPAVATEKAKSLVAAAVRRVAWQRPAGNAPGGGQAVRPGGGRRHRRDRGSPATGRLGQAGLSGRAGAVHRRAHGPALQDLPNARLCGLNTHTQNGVRGTPPKHPADDLQRGRASDRLRGQLQRERAAQSALRERGSVHGLWNVHGKMPVEEDPLGF